MTDEQFIYKTRKKGFGNPFKEKFWNLPDNIKDGIGKELEDQLTFLFTQLNAGNTRKYVEDSVKPVPVAPSLEDEIKYA